MATSEELRMSAGAVTYLMHHVVLPPKLPQESDYDPGYEQCLIDAVNCALQNLHDNTEDGPLKEIITSAITSISILSNCRDENGYVSELELKQIFRNLAHSPTDVTVPLELHAQNAGLLISRRGDNIIFEPFELSPTNRAAMSTVGRLIRTFPSSASTVPVFIMLDKEFRESLAYTIVKMSTQYAPDCRPKVQKNGIWTEEDRDTINPIIVTDWLMNYTAALGALVDSVRITKNTREQVLWKDCRHPWRRSALWLLIRVTLQLHFVRSGSSSQPLDGLYKLFVAQLLSYILRIAKDRHEVIGSEAVYLVCAKLARRLRKLEELDYLKLVEPRYTDGIKARMIDAHATIDRHWTALAKHECANINTDLLRKLLPERDLHLGLPELDNFRRIIDARRQSNASTDFIPEESYPFYSSNHFPSVLRTLGDHKLFWIAAFESWVELNLGTWLPSHLNDDQTCGRLYQMMKTYHTTASSAYHGIPASLSVMYLSLFELWVACDKSACSLFPLLKQYGPELRTEELQCLVLPLKSQMQRLLSIERYVKDRVTTATIGTPSVFRNFGHPSSFAVQYFNQSPQLQVSMSTIVDDATSKREQKRAELARLKLRYKDLMDEYNTKECDMQEEIDEDDDNYTRQVHSPRCQRCDSRNHAKGLSIVIHEWPLSQHKAIAKATVFELHIPQSFSDWRDASIFMIAGVLGHKQSGTSEPTPKYTLDKHHDIKHYLSFRYHERRIVPLSTVKPHAGTHRKEKDTIAYLEENDVCLANALQYNYYDTLTRRHTAAHSSTEHVVKNCMYRMSELRSKALEGFLYRPPSGPDGKTPNEVIASLADCPAHFSIEEYKGFGLLPSGRNIIYSNILAQLAMPSIDLTKVETQTLLLQVIGQSGVGDETAGRVSHGILENASFCFAMLEQLEISLQRVSKNWESWRAVATFVSITRRILSLTTSVDVCERSLRFLAEAREISMSWLARLKCDANALADHNQRSELLSNATEVALLCTQTFDVEDSFVDIVLEEQSAISILLQCSIMIQENHESTQSEAHSVHRIMLQSWKTLLYRLFTRIRHCILQGSSGLHAAVLKNWADFQPSTESRWAILSQTHEHWLHLKSGSLAVHFNLLTAELLVNGLPLSRLPANFMQHVTYKRLFGELILEVVPSDWRGMNFSALSSYLGYKLHFGFQDGDMLVVAVKDKIVLHLLPSRIFRDQLPVAFETEFIHWYDSGRNEVLFRSREDPWSSRPDDWILKRQGKSWHLMKGVSCLVDIFSKTSRTLSKIFGALEDSEHIHILLDSNTLSLHVQLPRLQLDFHVDHNDDRVQSRQYRGMIVDTDQTTGALIGLQSKLVLRPSNTAEDRLVLIPVPRGYGPENIARAWVSDQHHVSVQISKNDAHKVFAYSLDTTLGRILESGDMQRRLFLAFLHGATSHCLPDPLTGYTGTESALSILQSAAVRSFEYLTEDNVELLQQIADLSPVRIFYPAHLMDMESISFDNSLPALSQHPQLCTYVREIVQQALTMRLFYPENMPDISEWWTSDPHLEARDAIRTSIFRVWEFGADKHTSKRDVRYAARDVLTQSIRGQNAFVAATMIKRGQAALSSSIPDLKGLLLRSHFRSTAIKGLDASFNPQDLRFDTGWLCNSTANITEYWCSVHHALPSMKGSSNKYDIMAWLSTMAFARTADMDVIQGFAAFYLSPAMATVTPPIASSFKLSQGHKWNRQKIETIVRSWAKPYENSAESRLVKHSAETKKQYAQRKLALFGSRRDPAIEAFVNGLQQQWPTVTPVAPSSPEIATYIRAAMAAPGVTAKFRAWHENMQFLTYLHQTSALIAQQKVVAIIPAQPIHSAPINSHSTKGTNMMFPVENILKSPAPNISWNNPHASDNTVLVPPREPELPTMAELKSEDDGRMCSLEQFCDDLGALAISKCEKEYVNVLRASCASLKDLQVSSLHIPESWSSEQVRKLFQDHLKNCEKYFASFNLALAEAVSGNGSMSVEVGLRVQHSPRISPTFWLSHLHRDRFSRLSESWKIAIVEYGLAVTQLHRAQRLLAMSAKPADLLEELGHIGHTNWNPMDFPETLLLEAESAILIRREQEFIASHMRGSEDTDNIVLQLLMGGGKSSIIIPMLAAYLANKNEIMLVRIIVGRPQSKQMLHMLISKLGYLLNRRVYHMPFSRSLRPNAADIALIRKNYEECIANRGVLLIQPEHILSFKLMAVEATLTEKDCAQALLDTQEFFDQASRDLLDESDENYSVKFELVYTMGTQQSIEFAPDRWRMIQEIVGLIPRFAKQVKKELPEAIELQRDDAGRFPRIRFLRKDAAQQVLSLVAKHLVEYGINNLPTSSQPPSVQAALLRYITEAELTASEIAAVEDSKFWTDTTKSPLLLVRGLIAGGILQFAFSTKRWRVNYGLDPTRNPPTQLAVPFRSKDGPNPRSEFSHPDVVILLTLLSFYYAGLTDLQLFDSLAHVFNSDQADIQYSEWVATASPDLPVVFRALSGVTLKDRHRCIFELFPDLRYSRRAIDYYLSSLVFPKAMKEFPQKLSASGWDIGATKRYPVTGFSGTNDTLHLLPLTVKHLDLPTQSHTNALVLQYLLQDETSVELLPPRTTASGSDAKHLLELIVRMQPEVRVMLDCGASILEQNNQQVAEAWLKIRDSDVQAVVFFDDEELSVVDRAGRIEPLQTSPFAKQLDVCLVYLDEAHTRGTDLKLPRDYRAAVTLGQGLVKDKLTQGCMRMRKLGVGQSVTFIVPEEISAKICERTNKPIHESASVSDILSWAITETWQDLKKSMPLWAVQGQRFERNKNLMCGTATTQAQAEAFLEDESQTLEARYQPHMQEAGSMGMLKDWDLNNENIAKIVTRCQEFEAMGFGAATLSEEQERELAPEIEEERQIERPPYLDPHDHRIDPVVEHLVRTGYLQSDSGAFIPAFQATDSTSAAHLFKLKDFPTDLLVTADFERTVKPPAGIARHTFVSDSFQRPVQFVLSVPNATKTAIQHLVIISSVEANQLLPQIRKNAKVTLHIFAPCANTNFIALDKLQLYNVGRAFNPADVPRSLTVQLNLFTGSLYLRSFQEYTELCDFLGLLCSKPVEGQQVYADGFIYPPVGKWQLKRSPVPFLRILLMKIRREGDGIEKTHLGKILNGVRLEEADFTEDVEMLGT